jgi:hypothetical protein
VHFDGGIQGGGRSETRDLGPEPQFVTRLFHMLRTNGLGNEVMNPWAGPPGAQKIMLGAEVVERVAHYLLALPPVAKSLLPAAD